MRMRRTVCGFCGSTVFFDIISQTARFSEKNVTGLRMSVLIFSTIMSDIDINVKTSSREVHVILVGF
jgi:hypothetical protein